VRGGGEGSVQPGEEVGDVGEDIGAGGFGDEAVGGGDDDGRGGGGEVDEPGRRL